MNLFRNTKVEIDLYGTQLLVITHNRHLANRINRALDNYYPETIEEGAEPIFKIDLSNSLKMNNFIEALPLGIGQLIQSKIIQKHPAISN